MVYGYTAESAWTVMLKWSMPAASSTQDSEHATTFPLLDGLMPAWSPVVMILLGYEHSMHPCANTVGCVTNASAEEQRIWVNSHKSEQMKCTVAYVVPDKTFLQITLNHVTQLAMQDAAGGGPGASTPVCVHSSLQRNALAPTVDPNINHESYHYTPQGYLPSAVGRALRHPNYKDVAVGTSNARLNRRACALSTAAHVQSLSRQRQLMTAGLRNLRGDMGAEWSAWRHVIGSAEDAVQSCITEPYQATLTVASARRQHTLDSNT